MISKFSVRKPYTVLVAVILVIVLGAVSLMKMTADLLPDMSFQYALIITTDVGASPESVEGDVTAPIEASIATTSNIKNITSTSYNSYSMVICEYEQSANMDSVVIEIQQKLDQLKGTFPDSVGSPMIMQINPDMLPIMIAAVDMEDMTKNEIADYVNNELIPSLESVEGVASVSSSGAIEENIKVTISDEKIAAINEKLAKSINEKMDDAQKELTENKNKIEDAKKQITDGKDTLTSETGKAANEISNNKITLNNTRESLEAQLKTLKETNKTLSTSITSMNSLYDTACSVQAGLDALNQVKAGIEATKAGVKASTGMDITDDMALSMINEQTPTGFATVEELDAKILEASTGLEQINQGLLAQKDSFKDLKVEINSYQDIPNIVKALKASKKKVTDGISQIEDGINQIDDGLSALDDANKKLNESQLSAMLEMSNGYAELVTASSAIEQGQTQLDEARDSALDQADLTKTLTVDTVSKLLVAQNFDMPAGYAYDSNGKEFLVKVGDSVSDIEELKNLVLMDLNTDEVGIIKLSDVADIEISDNSDETYAVINGNPGVMLTFEKQSGYSTGEVTDRLLDRFDSLQKEEDKLHMSVLMNQGIYIDMVVKSVFQNMILGAILAIIVLLLFLKDLKPTIIIAVSIPLSVVTAVVLMYFSGITMNIISMSGLVLGIGMLVDNSIVVIENIYRLRNQGLSIKKAAVEGASQVTGAIFASTLTTVSVYAPIIFTEGITRQLFVDLSLTIAYTLMASLIVALTVVPAMSSYMLKDTKEAKASFFDGFREWYGRFLEICLNHKLIVFVVSIALLAGSGVLAFSRGMNFMDMEMEADQLSLTIEEKDEQNLEFEDLKKLSEEAISKIEDIDGIETIGSMIGGSSVSSMMSSGGSDSVSMYILLNKDRSMTLDEIGDEIEKRTSDMDCKITVQTNMMDMSAMMASGISVEIRGRDIDKLQELTKEVADIVSSTPGTIEVKDGLDNQADEYRITVDKEKAADYGYTVAQVFQLVYSKMASNTSATTLMTDLKDYDVYVQSTVQSQAKLSEIENLTFEYTNEDGDIEDIPLSDIAKLEKTKTLSTITRDSQTRYLTVSASIDDDHNITLVGNEIQEKLDAIEVPEGYLIKMTGEDEQIMEAAKQMMLMLILAIIFIYLIMVAQFQSLLNPFIIMFSIPLAFTGGFTAIYLSGEPLNMISMLGFIMLAGLIVNNGIVLIDYITQARKAGSSKREAIIESGKIRMRPILMTALTTILAMSTQALGFGDGSEMMAPMAISIIGGLIYGTILTLIVIPCLYDAFNKEKSMVEEEL